MREESHRVGIYAGKVGGTGLALCGAAYLLELEEIFSLSKNNTQMMCVWSNAGMGGVNPRYTVARFEFAFALDSLWGPTVVTFLLKGGRRMQIEYNDYLWVCSQLRKMLIKVPRVLTRRFIFILTRAIFQLMDARELNKNRVLYFLCFPLSDLRVGRGQVTP